MGNSIASQGYDVVWAWVCGPDATTVACADVCDSSYYKGPYGCPEAWHSKRPMLPL